jgi:acetolactate synthase-1/3 small subunit
MTQHSLIALLHDRPGVLHRTVTLLRRRGFNIVSLAVGRSEVPGISRMTLVVDAHHASQVVQQLDRLVEVIGVTDATNAPAIQRETAMLKIIAPPARVAGIADEALAAGARILELGEREIIMEFTDSPERVETFIDTMRPAGIAELMRTGRLAMLRGKTPRVLEAPDNFRAQADGAPFDDDAMPDIFGPVAGTLTDAADMADVAREEAA